MNVCPGLVADAAGGTARVFLGNQPSMVVEARLIKHMQPVYAWYASRKRVKEQGSELLELDGSTMDPELFLRHSEAFFTRKQVHAAFLDKQLQLLEGGKLPKEAQPSVLSCLGECATAMKERLGYEEKRLLLAKRCSSRELEPNTPVDAWDVPCLIRRVEEQESEMPDAESRAKAFLPLSIIQAATVNLAKTIVPADQLRTTTLDKKDSKLLARYLYSTYDYKKVGAIDKLRPLDVTAYHRFFGERVTTALGGEGSTANFSNLLWGNIFRKFASHPEYLMQSSQYWSKPAGVDNTPLHSQMPQDVAFAAAVQQQSLPAMRFALQNMYTSAEFSKQVWRSEWFVPLIRLHPLLGNGVAEDLMASSLVEGLWKKLNLSPTTNPLSEEIIGEIRQFVVDMSAMRQGNSDLLCTNVIDAVKAVIPPTLTDTEKKWVSDFEAGRLDPSAPLEDFAFNEGTEEVVIIEEGIPETDEIPNENLVSA